MALPIVFDLDGTLIDSAPDIQGIANAILLRKGLAPLSMAETKSFIGNGAAVLVARMRTARAIPDTEQDALFAEFVASYEDAVTLTQPYPGVRAALEHLRAKGHPLGICTNKPLQPARHVLAHLNLASFFDVAFGGDSFAVRKPDPLPLAQSFAALGAGDGLYIGDSEVDAETAERAVVPFFLFTEGYRKSPVDSIRHSQSFGDFAQLPGLIDGH